MQDSAPSHIFAFLENISLGAVLGGAAGITSAALMNTLEPSADTETILETTLSPEATEYHPLTAEQITEIKTELAELSKTSGVEYCEDCERQALETARDEAIANGTNANTTATQAPIQNAEVNYTRYAQLGGAGVLAGGSAGAAYQALITKQQDAIQKAQAR